MTGRENPSDISDKGLLETVEARLNSWGDFAQHSDEENVEFTLELSSSIIDGFSRGIGVVHGGEFKGEELPEKLKPLYTTLWNPYDFTQEEHILHVVLPSDMRIRMSKRAEHQLEPFSAPPEFFEIMDDESLTFNQKVERIEETPGLLDKISLGDLILDETVQIELMQGYGRNSLEFIVSKTGIKLFPYGDSRKDDKKDAQQLYEFAVKYNGKQALLAEMAAGLAVLSAKHFDGPWPSPSSDLEYTDLDRFIRRGY